MIGGDLMEATVDSVWKLARNGLGNKEAIALTIRDYVIDFSTWLSEQEELDVMTPDDAVDLFLKVTS